MTTVDHLSAGRLTFGAMINQIANRGRLAVMGVLAAVSIGLAVLISVANGDPSATGSELAASLVLSLGFYIIVPIVALVLSSASLGASHHDGTLVYLWLRPMARSPIAIGGWAAAYLVAVPFTMVATIGAALILGASAGMVAAIAAAVVTATAAYTSLFSVLSLMVRNAIAWGLAYVLVWEGVVASFGRIPARLSIRGYSASIIGHQLDDPREFAVFPTSTAVSLVVLFLITISGVAVSAWYLRSADIE